MVVNVRGGPSIEPCRCDPRPPADESPAFHSPRVRAAARGRKDPWPPLDCATGLLAEIGSDLLLATSRSRRQDSVLPPAVHETPTRRPNGPRRPTRGPH